jgi:hypothetical protein
LATPTDRRDGSSAQCQVALIRGCGYCCVRRLRASVVARRCQRGRNGHLRRQWASARRDAQLHSRVALIRGPPLRSLRCHCAAAPTALPGPLVNGGLVRHGTRAVSSSRVRRGATPTRGRVNTRPLRGGRSRLTRLLPLLLVRVRYATVGRASHWLPLEENGCRPRGVSRRRLLRGPGAILPLVAASDCLAPRPHTQLTTRTCQVGPAVVALVQLRVADVGTAHVNS